MAREIISSLVGRQARSLPGDSALAVHVDLRLPRRPLPCRPHRLLLLLSGGG